jgi:hypothetical protein
MAPGERMGAYHSSAHLGSDANGGRSLQATRVEDCRLRRYVAQDSPCYLRYGVKGHREQHEADVAHRLA